jgi:hypothetical protein
MTDIAAVLVNWEQVINNNPVIAEPVDTTVMMMMKVMRQEALSPFK